MKPKSLITVTGIIFTLLALVLPVAAQAQEGDNGQEYLCQDRQIELGLRTLGDYTFFSHKENDLYKSVLRPTALDLLISSDDPNFSWRISMESLAGAGSSNSNYYIDAINYGQSETDYQLSLGGLVGAFIYHSPLQKKLRFYGGLGLGFYSAREDYSISVYDVISTVSSTGITNTLYRGKQAGLDVFFGMKYRLSENASFGLECIARWLEIKMSDVADDYAKNLSGYGWYLVFNLKPS